MSTHSKVIARTQTHTDRHAQRQTDTHMDRHTNMTKTLRLPHTREVTTGEFSLTLGTHDT